MKVKVALGVLFLDKPTSYLDREGLGALVLAINDNKGGVLIISLLVISCVTARGPPVGRANHRPSVLSATP